MYSKNKITPAALKRSVFKEISKERKSLEGSLSIGKGLGGMDKIRCASDSILLEGIDLESHRWILSQIISRLRNHHYGSGSIPYGIVLNIYGRGVQESFLRGLIGVMNSLLIEHKLMMISGDTQLMGGANKECYVTFSLLGRCQREWVEDSWEGAFIYVSGYVGNIGTIQLASKYENHIQQRYDTSESSRLLTQLIAQNSLEDVATKLQEFPILYSRSITQGGILSTLWEMGEVSDVGFEVDLREVPINMMTILLSDLEGLNPYKMLTEGSLLFLSKEKDLDLHLEMEGIVCHQVGSCHKKDRLVVYGQEKMYLEKPDYMYDRKI